jgi:hypothetical protein
VKLVKSTDRDINVSFLNYFGMLSYAHSSAEQGVFLILIALLQV